MIELKKMISTTSALLYADNTPGNENVSYSSDDGSGPESDASDSGIESDDDPLKVIVARIRGVRPDDLRWSKREDNYVLKQGRGQPDSDEESDEDSQQPDSDEESRGFTTT
jgi:hypothetical protein